MTVRTFMLLLRDYMKYQVTYLKPKKKGYSQQTATFLKIEDASFWEKIMKEQNCANIEIIPIFSE
jgi:hypothetical protein